MSRQYTFSSGSRQFTGDLRELEDEDIYGVSVDDTEPELTAGGAQTVRGADMSGREEAEKEETG
jgi:hypothetical protein